MRQSIFLCILHEVKHLDFSEVPQTCKAIYSYLVKRILMRKMQFHKWHIKVPALSQKLKYLTQH